MKSLNLHKFKRIFWKARNKVKKKVKLKIVEVHRTGEKVHRHETGGRMMEKAEYSDIEEGVRTSKHHLDLVVCFMVRRPRRRARERPRRIKE